MQKFAGGIFPRLVALFPLLFPFYLFKGTIFGMPVTLTEVALGVLFIWFLLQRYEIRFRDFRIWPVWLFVLAAVIGVLVVPESATMMDGTAFPTELKALGIFKGWILAPLLYFFIARTVFRDKPSMIPLALRAMLLSGAALSVLALRQEFTGDFLTLDYRASGPFESANYLSLYLGPLAIFSSLAAFGSNKTGDRVFLILCSVLVFLGLYFTESYAAWLAVLAALSLAILLTVRKKSTKLFWLTLGGLFLLGAGLFLSQIGTEKFAQFLNFSDRSSSSVRMQVYEISLALLKQHPFSGIGLGQFEQQYQEVAVSVLGKEPFEWNMLHSHNIFLAFWLNMGIFGLAAFIWLIGKGFLWLTEFAQEPRKNKERPLAALMLTVIVAHGFFDTPYFKNDLAFQFWLLMAMLL